MPIDNIEHTFFDFEVEHIDGTEQHLIKVLAVDGRRFTYQLTGPLDDHAVSYIKTVIDAACFGDMLIERTAGADAEFIITESPRRLKTHS